LHAGDLLNSGARSNSVLSIEVRTFSTPARSLDVADGHTHAHAPANIGRAFAIGVALNLGFVIAEFLYGRLAHSLALVADAGHNLSDVLSLLLAWGAMLLSQRLPTQRRTYGFRRSSILASLINAVVLLLAVGAIGWEALQRLGQPEPVGEVTVIWVAAVGIVVNGVTAVLFMAGREHDLNIKGAFLHMASDAAVSFGVVLAGVVILLTDWFWLDPVISLIVMGVVLVGTWGLLRDSVNLALDAVPEHIQLPAVEAYLRTLPGVVEIHDLHIWGMSTTEVALTAHLVMPDTACEDRLLSRVCGELHDQFGIEHATLQVENGDPDYPCRRAAEDVV
jgi:cobalt-zinc-cadmium efflux system protein